MNASPINASDMAALTAKIGDTTRLEQDIERSVKYLAETERRIGAMTPKDQMKWATFLQEIRFSIEANQWLIARLNQLRAISELSSETDGAFIHSTLKEIFDL